MSFKIGDTVAVTDDAIKGKVTAVDNDVISILTEDDFIMKFAKKELVKIGVEQSEIAKTVIVSAHLSNKEDYKKGQKRIKSKKNKGEIPPMEVNLHIDKLIKSSRGMDNYDMLTLQMDTAKHKLEFAIRNRIPRIVFIHGVGAGVLKTELDYLFNNYNVKISEASYQKYGMGATEVYIYQSVK
ncbi:MAG: DNA mismatch repair protein MutS [Flavobacteriaceae bacterium]|nr:DNA mismatch repair protein MutS [Flavobacteriaceae bacterium]